jgi:hypothetical protein
MFGIPATQLVNQLQNILLLFGAGLAAKGYFSGDQLTAIVTGLCTFIVVVLNWVNHKDALNTPVNPAPAVKL